MAPRVPLIRSCTNCDGRPKTQNAMLSFRCWSSTTVPTRWTPTTTAKASIRPSSLRWRSFYGLNLLLLTVLAGEMITPVRSGLMDFSPPGIIQYGTCAQPKDHESFRYEQFSGLWYQVEMVANNYMEAKKCITLDFRWTGKAYNVTTVGLNEYNEETQQEATITQVQPEDPATMKPYLQIWAPGVPPVPYHVVKTNYHHFACVYSCYELFSLMFEVFSVLSRSPEIDTAYLAACYRAFDTLELDLTRLAPVQQTGECLGMELEGSGAGPELQDEEEEEDENALATLTSEEVNQRWASNPASAPRSELATGGETMMEEEMEDLLEEIEGRRGGRRGGERREEASFQTRNRTVVDATLNLNEESAVGSAKLPNSYPRRPDIGHRRRPTKGGRRRRKGAAGEGKEDDDSEFYIDDFPLDSIKQEENRERGRGKSGHGEEDEERTVTTSESEFPWSWSKRSSSSAPAPTSLLLIALLSVALWPRIRAS